MVSSESRPPFPSIIQPSQARDGQSTSQESQLTSEDYHRLTEEVQLMPFAFDRIPEAILIADSDKKFRYANHAAAQALGYTKEELEHLAISDIAPNHDNARYQEHLKELREGKTLSYYTTHRTKDGQEIPISISVYLFNFQGKEFTCAITKPSKKTTEAPQNPNERPIRRAQENRND